MKKILLIIGLISSLSLSFAEQNVIEVRSGYDVYNHVKDKDGDEDDDLFENGWKASDRRWTVCISDNY